MGAPTLPDFVQVGPRTSVYTPESPVAGQLIILCTWLGAGRKPIAKYVNLYRQIAPGARILLIESGVGILTSSYVHQRREILSAVSVVLDTLAERDEKPVTTPKIVLQTFSNGGTNTATQLLIVLQQRLQKPLPLAGLICDSGPAKGTYWKSYDAMLLSLPRGMLSKILGPLICHTILVLLYSWIAWGNENPATLQRRTMLDNHFVWGTWTDAESKPNGEGRACYLYSKADRMCQSTDVSDHAQEARRKGWQVKEIDFEDSAHCAHYAKYETQYSQAVRSMWDGPSST